MADEQDVNRIKELLEQELAEKPWMAVVLMQHMDDSLTGKIIYSGDTEDACLNFVKLNRVRYYAKCAKTVVAVRFYVIPTMGEEGRKFVTLNTQ